MVKSKATTNDTNDETKPKRVLTEAQRLAFLKGREKRMANIEMKRQQLLETEPVELPPVPESPTTDVPDESPATDEDVPPIPILKRQTNVDVLPDQNELTEIPKSPVQQRGHLSAIANDDQDIMARKIADYVFEKFQLTEVDNIGLDMPESPPKKKKVTIAGASRIKTSTKQRTTSSSSISSRELKTPVVEPIPQRSFSWA